MSDLQDLWVAYQVTKLELDSSEFSKEKESEEEVVEPTLREKIFSFKFGSINYKQKSLDAKERLKKIKKSLQQATHTYINNLP